jgi:hypothetical protein
MKKKSTTKLARAEAALGKIINELARAQAQREDAIKSLIKAEAKIKEAERIELKLAKCVAKLREEVAEPPAPTPSAAPEPPPAPADDGIPVELRRLPPLMTPNELREQVGLPPIDPDAYAPADQLAEEIAERKKAKAHGRIARMKAKQSGATKRMPLSGKEALAAIRGD